jgi:hypothetical protein
MNALRSGRTSMGAACLAMASLSLSAAHATATHEAGSTVDAIWRPQVVDFVYRADDTFYSCSVLWEKITGILTHLGARTSGQPDRLTCANFADTVRLQIALESPVEATDANLHAVTSFGTEDQLVARLRGEQLPAAGDVPHFPAAWKTVSMRDTGMRLTAGDCELVHHLRRQVLPKLSMQVVKEPPRCRANLSSGGGPPAMKVRALVVAG